MKQNVSLDEVEVGEASAQASSVRANEPTPGAPNKPDYLDFVSSIYAVLDTYPELNK